MYKKGVFNLQGMIIGMLLLGLFMGIMGISIYELGTGYNIDGYEESDLEPYMILESNLTADLQTAAAAIESTTVSPTVFDWFAEMWNKLTKPFRFIYQSYTSFTALFQNAVTDLGLYSIFGDFFAALILVLVIIGIVMIKYYMARQK